MILAAKAILRGLLAAVGIAAVLTCAIALAGLFGDSLMNLPAGDRFDPGIESPANDFIDPGDPADLLRFTDSGEPMAGSTNTVPTDEGLAVPDGAVRESVSGVAHLTAWNCPLPADETADFVKRRMGLLGWKPAPEPAAAGGRGGIGLAFARGSDRCWAWLQPKGTGGCRLIYQRLGR